MFHRTDRSKLACYCVLALFFTSIAANLPVVWDYLVYGVADTQNKRVFFIPLRNCKEDLFQNNQEVNHFSFSLSKLIMVFYEIWLTFNMPLKHTFLFFLFSVNYLAIKMHFINKLACILFSFLMYISIDMWNYDTCISTFTFLWFFFFYLAWAWSLSLKCSNISTLVKVHLFFGEKNIQPKEIIVLCAFPL